MDLNYELRGQFLRCIYFFAHLESENTRAIRDMSDKAVVMNILAPHDILFYAGDRGNYTYICAGGEMSYCRNDQPHLSIQYQDWLAEASMWTHWEHCGHLSAVEQSTVLAVDVHSFHEVMRDYVVLGIIV